VLVVMRPRVKATRPSYVRHRSRLRADPDMLAEESSKMSGGLIAYGSYQFRAQIDLWSNCGNGYGEGDGDDDDDGDGDGDDGDGEILVDLLARLRVYVGC
jgi:hypothetical protein